MSISPIGFTPGFSSLPSMPSVAAPAPGGEGFAGMVTDNLERLQGLHSKSDKLIVKAATGDLTDIHDYMIASSQSSVATELTVAVRNRAVEAFTEVMRMNV